LAAIVGSETGGVAAAPEAERTEFLRMVGLWVFGGMMLAYAAAAGSAVTVLMFPVMQNRLIWLPIFFGTFAFSHYVAKQMVYGEFKEIGFALGCISEGIALGFLMLSAVMTSTETFGAKGFGPFTILGEAAIHPAGHRWHDRVALGRPARAVDGGGCAVGALPADVRRDDRHRAVPGRRHDGHRDRDAVCRGLCGRPALLAPRGVAQDEG